MWTLKVLLILGCVLSSHLVLSIWQCENNEECAPLTAGSVCQAGLCVCPTGTQLVNGGRTCAPVAPYFTSPCYDDYQCSNLVTSFKCVYPRVEEEEEESEEDVSDEDNDGDDNDDENDDEDEETQDLKRTGTEHEMGRCGCQPGYHYFIGRCWRSVHHGGECERNEECLGGLLDPYNMACEEGRCVCSPGYYERQRGECRKGGHAVGEACVLDEDCRFTNGVCDIRNFRCYDSTNPSTLADLNRITTATDPLKNITTSLTRNHGTLCSTTNTCQSPFVCSQLGTCDCPRGFYPNAAGTTCFAELGTPSTQAQCAGFLAVLVDGVCGCPANFYFNPTMRDCVKATRRITDICVFDEMCHTFGASSRCGPPDDGFGFRHCECIPEQAVWDAGLGLCRLFAGVGEACEVDSDCMAGNLVIQCLPNEAGQGICTCPEGTTNVNGLCITSGLSLGQECQVTAECTETPNTICAEGRCSCEPGFLEQDGFCAPTIDFPCLRDEDCAIENTVCVHTDYSSTCQCDEAFLLYQDKCWPELPDRDSECEVPIQCHDFLGDGSDCIESRCECALDHHLSNDRCWPKIDLFGACSRSTECYLGNITNRVQCRNSLCQCSFDFPYSEELHTCTGGRFGYGGASGLVSSTLTIIIGLIYYLMIK